MTLGEDVALDDILDFKEKRSDELVAFRGVMDELYLEVIRSGDIPRSKIVVVSKLERTIGDLHKAANESWASKLISSLKIDLNIPTIAKGALAGAYLGSSFGVSAPIGAAIGAVGAAVKFDICVTRKIAGIPNELKDYAYLYYLERDLR